MEVLNCGSCRFCLGMTGQEGMGMCRRYPPQPFPIIQSSQGVIGSQEKYRVPAVLSYNPPVKFSDPACGEWEGQDEVD